MSVSLLIDPLSSIWNNTGSSLENTLEFYLAGTSTPATTYTTSVGDVANSNPLSLTGGRATVYGTDGVSYKIVLKDVNGATLKTLDAVYPRDSLKADLASTASGKGAGLIGWLSNLASAVARTLYDWLLDRDVSVLDFMTTAERVDVRAGTALVDVVIAIQAAADSLATNQTLVIPYGLYHTTNTITFPGTINVKMQGTILYKGTHTKPAVVWGALATQMAFKKGVFRIDSNVQSDWTNTAYKGLVIYDAVDCDITINMVRGFTIGAEIYGDATGSFYNTYHLDQLVNNSVGLDLVTPSGGSCNESLFIKGRFAVDTIVNTSSDRVGIRARNGGGAALINNNTFLSPSFEMNAAGTTGTAEAIDWQGCAFNRILNCRSEGNDDPSFIIGVDCYDNEITTGFGDATVTDTSLTPSTRASSASERIKEASVSEWNSGPLGRIATDYDGTDTMIPTCETHHSNDTLPTLHLDNILITNRDYIETASTSRGVSISIDTSISKKFVVRRNAVDSFGGRVVIVAYDANNAILSGSSPLYIAGQSGLNFSSVATYGNAYQTGADSDEDTYFECAATVESVEVIITAGTAQLKLRSFSVHNVDLINRQAIRAFFRAERPDDNARYASTAPTVGTYVKGTRIYDDTPSGSSFVGWVCTASGTFSSATDATGDPDGSTAVIPGLTDTSDFVIGDFVTVSAGMPSASTPYRIEQITATTITLNVASTSSQTNVTIATVDPVFKTYGVTSA